MEFSTGWILLGLVVWVLGGIFIYALLKMSRDQDRAARHTEKSILPDSDVTITRMDS